MSGEDADECRRKADALLNQAVAATDLNERSRLIDEAAVWHLRAISGIFPNHSPLDLPDDEEPPPRPLRR
jgi:hypothetical protein